jgi:hypothetical protein
LASDVASGWASHRQQEQLNDGGRGAVEGINELLGPLKAVKTIELLADIY